MTLNQALIKDGYVKCKSLKGNWLRHDKNGKIVRRICVCGDTLHFWAGATVDLWLAKMSVKEFIDLVK